MPLEDVRPPADVRPAAVVVLAAGRGTRMRSAVPKVLFEVCGRSLLGHVLAAAKPLDAHRTLVVVGHEREQVAAELFRVDPEATPVVQTEQRGTGHAARLALEAIQVLHRDGVIIVLPGDAPLLRTQTLRLLLQAHSAAGASATLLTAVVDDPTGYGRVVRDTDGGVRAIVEHRDADATTLDVREVGTGVYAFAAGVLLDRLRALSTDNAAGEEYLTDVIAAMVGDGEQVGALAAAETAETAGVNDRVQLAAAGGVLRTRLLEAHMRAGVTVIDPSATWLDVDVVLEPDVVVHPGTTLRGRTTVQRGAVVGPHSTLTDTVVRPGASVVASTCTGADVGEGASVGPYSHLRPGTRLGRRTKVGAYVETKSLSLGDEAKVPHLSYVGDATVGARANIGAGTITVNYDGVAKHRTVVGDDARVGSNTSLVAPVTVGEGAYTGADAVVRHDVPPGALSYSTNEQVVIDGWVARRRGSRP